MKEIEPSLFFPAHLSHHIFVWKESNSVHWERSKHGDSQALEECSVTLQFVLLPCTIPSWLVFEVFKVLRLHDCLHIVNRVGEKPRIWSSQSSSKESSKDRCREWSFSFRGELSHDVLVRIKINGICQDLSQKGSIKAQIQASQPKSPIYIKTSIYWSLVDLWFTNLFLHDNSCMVCWSLYCKKITIAKELTIPVRIPLRKIWLIGMMVCVWGST